MPLLALVLSATFSLAADDPPAPHVWEPVITKKLAEIELPPSVLGEGWKPSAGIRVDDLDNVDPATLPEPERQVVPQLKAQLSPLGIHSVADYSLVQAAPPLNSVTVRVFLFRNPDQCRTWWEQKYRYAGWEKHYKPVPSDQAVALDSLQTNKRVVAYGNVWITAHQLGAGDEHITALRHIIDALKRP